MAKSNDRMIETVHKDMGTLALSNGAVVTASVSSFQSIEKGKLGPPSAPGLYVKLTRPTAQGTPGWRPSVCLKVRVSEAAELAPILARFLGEVIKTARAA